VGRVRAQSLLVCVFAYLLATSQFVWAARAMADEERSLAEAISVDGPPCVEKSGLVADVTTTLGRTSLDPRIRIAVHNQDGRLATIEISRDGRIVGERRIGGPDLSCATLQSVVRLAIASALDATLLPSLASPGVSDSAASTPVPDEARAPPTLPPNASRQRLSIEGDAIFLLDVLPVAVLGAELSVGYRVWPWFEPRLAFFGTANESFAFALGSGGTRANLFAGRGEGCFLGGAGLLRGHACAGFAAGAVPAEGFGLTPNYTITRGWGAAVLRLEGEVRIVPAFGVVLGADGYLPVVSPSFETLAPSGSAAHQRGLPPLGLAMRAGILVAFL
jgi:hypothetical protein